MKLLLYSSFSLLACTALITYAYITHHQFYPAVIFLFTSKLSLIILANTAFVITIYFAWLMQKLFFGTLRGAEAELLHENIRFAVTDSCLALTIFRDELSLQIGFLLLALILTKAFHWLIQARLEYMEQSDTVTRGTQMRITLLLILLAVIDIAFVIYCGQKLMEHGPSVPMLFGFEFLVLMITLTAIAFRYVLYIIDSRTESAWNEKFTYLFYLELVSEIIKLVIYVVFLLFVLKFYGVPLHIVRDLWRSVMSLQRKITSFYRYRRIAANLDRSFPVPTEEELNGSDKTCIICREEMTPVSSRKLPCAHIFHMNCLKMWVQRQQTCPTCRSIIPTGMNPVHREPLARNEPAPVLYQAVVRNVVPQFAPSISDIGMMAGMPVVPLTISGNVSIIQQQIDQLKLQLSALQQGSMSGNQTQTQNFSSSLQQSSAQNQTQMTAYPGQSAASPERAVLEEDWKEDENENDTDSILSHTLVPTDQQAVTESHRLDSKTPQNEAERRRQELRQRYNRIYTNTSSNSE